MLENGEKCEAVFPKAQDEVFILSKTPNIFSLLS